MFLGACETLPPPVPVASAPATAPPMAEKPRWWYVRFPLNRDADNKVRSYLDGMIADQILFAPIAEHGADMALWRFHRRWAKDATGHQFSFIFLAPAATAMTLIEQIEHNPLLGELLSDGLLRELRVDEPDSTGTGDPAATSDIRWPPELQRQWPKFIMGASQMWLGLIHEQAEQHKALELRERYLAVETSLDELWFKEANHALFHHLSALFGYKPVKVIRRDTMIF